MSVSHKFSNTQMYRLMVYRRALHPELFNLHARKLCHQSNYDVECWIAARGHIVRFQSGEHTLTEAVIETVDHLPELGLVHAMPCLGEKEFCLDADSNPALGFVSTIQTESLTASLYKATYREMHDFAQETGAMYHETTDPEGAVNLTVLDLQTYKQELHVQSYHLLGGPSLVLRTQSIFEIL